MYLNYSIIEFIEILTKGHRYRQGYLFVYLFILFYLFFFLREREREREPRWILFLICLPPLSYFNIFLVRLSLVGLDWVGLDSPNIRGSSHHVYCGLFTLSRRCCLSFAKSSGS